MQQTEELLRPFRQVAEIAKPRRGWVRSIQEALGVTNVQLAKKLNLKPQTIEDMQGYEVSETIKIQTLRKLADALGCRLIYAIVPAKPLEDMRLDRAREVARRQLQHVSHSMRLESQGVPDSEEAKEFDRLVKDLLTGNPKKLWE